MNDTTLNLIGRIAYINAILSFLSTVTIALFFSLGGYWGLLNDANSVFWMLTFVPIIHLFYRLHKQIAPLLAHSAAVIGVGAALAFAMLQALLVLGVVTFQQTFLSVTTLAAVVGVALLIFGVLMQRAGTFPNGLTWLTIGYALAFIVGGLGFWLGGWEHPLGIGGFLLTALLGPVWGVWLGRVLRNGRLSTVANDLTRRGFITFQK